MMMMHLRSNSVQIWLSEGWDLAPAHRRINALPAIQKQGAVRTRRGWLRQSPRPLPRRACSWDWQIS